MSSKKLRNVRFEVPQMSEEMGGPVLFQTLQAGVEFYSQYNPDSIAQLAYQCCETKSNQQ